MRYIQAALLLASIILVSGCELHQIKGEVGGVQLEAKAKSGNGDFCPPGQAKKGNC